MAKCPIKKEFFPFTLLTPPVKNPQSAGKMGQMMKPPESTICAGHFSQDHPYNGWPAQAL